jgi:hypothetical protein
MDFAIEVETNRFAQHQLISENRDCTAACVSRLLARCELTAHVARPGACASLAAEFACITRTHQPNFSPLQDANETKESPAPRCTPPERVALASSPLESLR